MGPHDESLASQSREAQQLPSTPDAGSSGPALSNVSSSGHELRDTSVKEAVMNTKVLSSVTNKDRLDARIEPIKSELVENQQKESAEPETAEQLEVEGFLDPQEQGIISTLYEASSLNFKVLLKFAKAYTSGLYIPLTIQGYTDISSSSHPVEPSHVESLQKDFIRFNVWGEEFNVASGKLDEGLKYSEGLKEDLILVLLHLCDALYQGLPYLTTSDTIEGSQQLDTVRLLEIAQSYIEENVYLGIDGTSFASIVEEVSLAIEGLGDLSFCLEVPAVDLVAVTETPRAPSEVTAAESHRVYEEMIRHRFPKADPIAISQHATANYFRFITLQNLRREAEEEGPESECDEAEHSPAIISANVETETVTQTMFHDSGIGTSHRHESSYAKSLMSFTKHNKEQYTKLLPKLPPTGALGAQFNCNICMRKVSFRDENAWTTHVIEDLLPYVCVFHDCSRSKEPFETRKLWLNHLKSLHKTSLDVKIMTCNLCKETVSSGHVFHITHMESHLIEIALSVMPTNGDPDPEEVKPIETYHPEWHTSFHDHFSTQVHTGFDSNIPLEVKRSNGMYESEIYDPLLATVQHNNEPLEKAIKPLANDMSEDEDYTPNSKTERRRHSSARTIEPVSTRARRRKDQLPREHAVPDDRPFLCPLAFYGCAASYTSKNEWKRHVSTQHIRNGRWRCDLCGPRFVETDEMTIYHNDFNRKDLFTQHLRRMHARPRYSTPTDDKYPVNEDNLADHIQRCFQMIREPPPRSSCLFCTQIFTGGRSWDERMEHMGRHLEVGLGSLHLDAWRDDKELENYWLQEGIVARSKDGKWRIGDGTPLRMKADQGDGDGADEEVERESDD